MPEYMTYLVGKIHECHRASCSWK